MKNLKLINLTSSQMNRIKAGDSGTNPPTCSCTCTCDGQDTTYDIMRGNNTSAHNASTISSIPPPPSPI